MIYSFSDLQQTDENSWQARYHGNYGTYTVTIEFDANGKRKSFSCTCPSSGNPCKHIGFLQNEIQVQSQKIEIKQQQNRLTVEDILQNVTLDELRTFVIKKAKFNNDLTKAITLEFAEKIKDTFTEKYTENIYKSLIESDLCDVDTDLDGEDFYYDDCAEIDLSILYSWYEKAKIFMQQEKYTDALFVCQAVIEKYAEWYELSGDARDYIGTDYQENFFDLLTQMSENGQIDKDSLYDYCKAELQKQIYYSDTFKMFNDLMAKLASAANSEEFIASQKNLLKIVEDKSSYGAENIVKRLYGFYLSNNRKDEADMLVEENVQIESFCKLAVEKRINEKRFGEAKQLVSIFLENNAYIQKNEWNDYLLTIAQKEKDLPTIRKIAFEFIETRFQKEYFTTYKSTFSEKEWQSEFEKLYKHYEKTKVSWRFNEYNIPDLLVAEKLIDRLMDYVYTHLTAEIMNRYYSYFIEKNSEKTLKMWRNAVDFYAEKNVGKKYYASVCQWLKLIQKIQGGDIVARQMIDNYLIIYKRRPKMIEQLEKL